MANFNPDEFINDILKDVSFSSNEREVMLAAAKNPIVAKRLEEAALRQSDYSKKMSEAQTQLKKNQDYWDNLVVWKSGKESEFIEQEKTLKKQRIDAGVDVGVDNKSEMVTAEQLQALAQQSVLYNNTVTKLGMQHLKTYNEVLDLDKVLEIATKDKVNIVQAYEIYQKPKQDEIRESELQKALTKAREEGKEEAIKNFSLPTSEQPQNGNLQPHALDAFNKGSGDNKYGVMAAVAAYSKNMRAGKHAGSDGF